MLLFQMPKRKQWDKEAMEKAVKAVKRGEMGYKRAVKLYGVPRSTLKDYVKNDDAATVRELIDQKIGRRTVLPKCLENDLARYATEMENRLFGLTMKDLRRIAFKLAERNNIRHPFSNDNEAAGMKWLALFFKRNPQLSLRKPQSLSLARVHGFTPENVAHFFSILLPEMEKINHNPMKVFNVDETGISVCQHKNQKIVALKGKKDIHKLSSAERGALVTAVMCMSAAGQFVPPMLIFPRKTMKADLLDGAPPGTISWSQRI